MPAVSFTGLAIVAAGLLSVLIFPLAALTLLRGGAPPSAGVQQTAMDTEKAPPL